ncbi:RQC domain-containing protein [Phormidesmis priestleyi]
MNANLDRSNIHYEVCFRGKSFYTELVKKLQSADGAKVIYRSRHQAVETLALKLQQDGISALPCHSRLSAEQQVTNRTQFLNNRIQVLVTTGSSTSSSDIYKSHVSLVIHHELPQNLNRYFRETRKAGKDEKPTRCILCFNYQDIRSTIRLTGRRFDLSSRDEEAIYTDLQQVTDYVLSSKCRLSLLSNQPEVGCGKCDNCLSSAHELDWTIDAQKFLSCVARFAQRGESFGSGHTIQVLRGSTDEKIFRHRHHELST